MPSLIPLPAVAGCLAVLATSQAAPLARWEGFGGFLVVDAEVGRGGIQEAASRLILLVIHSVQDGVEN